MFFYVVSRTYAEIFSLLRICSGLLSNSPGLIPNTASSATKVVAPLFRVSALLCSTFLFC